MKKMMLLASMVALAAMMLAAAPAFAQDGGDNKVTICHFPPGNPENAHTISVGEAAVPAHLAHGDFRGPCVFDRDVFDRDFFDRDFFDRDVVDVVPVISQDIEQEAESGDIDQSFDVSQTGDNSNQTVGIQGTANTGNAQNITNVVDAGNFGDFDNNNNNDGFVICDYDNDGDNDECDDFNNNDGFVFSDRDHDGRDDGDDECFVVFPDRNDDGFFNDDGRFIVNDNDDGDEFEIEDSGAEITMSPTNTTNSHQEVNQAAVASAPQWVWTASGWMLV
jgi:hypothetical protein